MLLTIGSQLTLATFRCPGVQPSLQPVGGEAVRR